MPGHERDGHLAAVGSDALPVREQVDEQLAQPLLVAQQRSLVEVMTRMATSGRSGCVSRTASTTT
jgi:hypothetical protein